MSNDEEFLSQEPFIYLSRIELPKPTRKTRSRTVIEPVESDSDSVSSYSIQPGKSPSRMSRLPRKRTSGDVEEIPQHTNKARGGPLSLKKVKFGLNYDPDTDKLAFTPVNSERYKLISVILPPTYSDSVSDLFIFFLTTFQSKKINVENYCVLLRLAYFSKQEEDYEDIFDYGMDIRINDVILPMTAPNPDNPAAPLDGPADITRYLVAEGRSTERVKISFDGQPKPHIFSVIFCKKLKEELPYLPLKYIRPDQTFKLAAKANDRFLADPKKIFRRVYTLLDPLSKQRIENPVRGHSCKHVECFDEKTFLRANRRKLDWRCPVPNCPEKISEEQLVVDGLFTLILNKTFPSCSSVELDTNGGWCPIYREKVFRTRTVDLENDFSEGEEDEEEEETQPKSPETPLSPVEVPPEPEEPEFHLESTNGHMNGDDPMSAISREAETQTWEQTFEIEKSESSFVGQHPQQQQSHQHQDLEMMAMGEGTREPRSSGAPVTVIQRVDDDERVPSRSQEMEEVD